jgi:hypothetical protein
MTRLSATIKWRDVSSGNVQNVSNDIKSASVINTSIPFSLNLLFDKVLGEAVSRLGTTRVGSQVLAGNRCLGLFQHLDSDATKNALFGVFGTHIYNLASGAAAGTLTALMDANFATFLNQTLMLNSTQKYSYSDAGGWIDTAGVFDLDHVPSGAKFPIEFKDRMYCAVTDRIYYTTTSSVSTPSVSWVAAGSGSLQAEQEDGGGTLQGLSKVPGYLLIYKQRSLKRWNFDSSFPEDLVNIGTQSHKSIVRARGKNYFFYGPNGFYSTDGGYPECFSRPVQAIIDGIDSAFYPYINGWSDNNDIYWSVGDVTVNWGRGFTETFNKVVLRYTIDTQQWAPLQYAHKFYAMNQYISGNDTLIAAGDADGQVMRLNYGNSDYNAQGIKYILQSPEFDFSNREYYKTISDRIFVHSDVTNGAELQCRMDYGNWKSIGTLKDIVTDVKLKPILRARVFEFRIVDIITGEQVKLRGLDFPNVDVEV